MAKSIISHIALVHSSDTTWKRGKKRKNNRVPYGSNAYQKLTYTCEKLVRRLLGTQLSLSSLRTLMYRQNDMFRFREIDAILLSEHAQPSSFIEIKTNVKNKTWQARRQLNASLAIANRRWKTLSGVIFWVDASCLSPPEYRHTSGIPATCVEEAVDLLSEGSLTHNHVFRIDLKALLEEGFARGYITTDPATLCARAARALESM